MREVADEPVRGQPGTLEAAARLATDWFISHLAHGPAR